MRSDARKRLTAAREEGCGAEGGVVSATLAEAGDIDAELRELQSFVMVETGHVPTAEAVAALRSRIAKTLGHSDPWCVSHCRPGVRHSACGCRCGQHCAVTPEPTS